MSSTVETLKRDTYETEAPLDTKPEVKSEYETPSTKISRGVDALIKLKGKMTPTMLEGKVHRTQTRASINSDFGKAHDGKIQHGTEVPVSLDVEELVEEDGRKITIIKASARNEEGAVKVKKDGMDVPFIPICGKKEPKHTSGSRHSIDHVTQPREIQASYLPNELASEVKVVMNDGEVSQVWFRAQEAKDPTFFNVSEIAKSRHEDPNGLLWKEAQRQIDGILDQMGCLMDVEGPKMQAELDKTAKREADNEQAMAVQRARIEVSEAPF